MNTTDKPSRNAHPVVQDGIRKALKIIFELQLEILKLDDSLSHLRNTAFWVTRLTAEDFHPDEFHMINKQYTMLNFIVTHKKNRRKKRNSRPVAHPTPTAVRAAPAHVRRKARRRP
jgi:hypothetical protein